ncbi:MAG: helix-hairpin-helix domain-containing protein [Verrucomicrobiota bacterium]
MNRTALLTLTLGILLPTANALGSTNPLQKFEDCTLVPTDWADGDSFLVRLPNGDEQTVRLYGVDCVEWHVTDETDARRLRAQRRYFGITEAGGSAAASIQLAKGFGEAAGEAVREQLAEPFTLYTGFADARGDGKYPRVYGFIVTAEGDDLAEWLVKHGLARAYGVSRGTYAGLDRDDFRERLQDLELLAARKGDGIWSETLWDKLPAERQLQRDEDRELALATDSEALREGETVDLNRAARDELMRLPGIGEALANRIIEGRPFQTVEELEKVSGIGEVMVERLRGWVLVE